MYFVYLFVWLVGIVASCIGAICGIGGGVIIKPVLDSLGILSVSAVSFLSGFTVLSMSGYSVVKAVSRKEFSMKMEIGIPISIGAVIGGISGKYLLNRISDTISDKNFIGAVQAGCLLVLTLGTLLYTLMKSRLKTQEISSAYACIAAGLVLGLLSSFLGIGGGPFNLVVLSYLFSMSPKIASQCSLFIILFSQASNLVMTVATNNVPEFSLLLALGMALSGILGAELGRGINRKIDDTMVDKLFIGLLVLISVICIYNIFKYA